MIILTLIALIHICVIKIKLTFFTLISFRLEVLLFLIHVPCKVTYLMTLHLKCNLYSRRLFWHFPSLKFCISLLKFSCTRCSVVNMIIELECSNVSNFLLSLFRINMYDHCFIKCHSSFFS